jgi:hypothetical protein
LLIVTTKPYLEADIAQIIRIRCQEEDAVLTPDAGSVLAQIVLEATLRYAQNLISCAQVIAHARRRKAHAKSGMCLHSHRYAHTPSTIFLRLPLSSAPSLDHAASSRVHTPADAFHAHITASKSISTPITSAFSSGKVNFASFTTFHELWRWVEYLIWRAVALGACIRHHPRRHAQRPLVLARALLRLQRRLARGLCRAHRCTVSSLYIRALVFVTAFRSYSYRPWR